ncbi:MAG: hypothetical protein LQ345_004453 [Seirophora villosa]|nr:MAG: hypothetical protein LQ345_004453 [Seirophora villosa]
MSEPALPVDWKQPEVEDPTRYILCHQQLLKTWKEQGHEGYPDSISCYKAWNSLTLDERQAFDRGEREDRYKLAMADFNANIPLSPSVSGASSSDSETEDEGDRRAIQKWNRYRRDHRSKKSRDAVPASTVPFPFLRLPFDIRRMVYALIVSRPHPVTQMDTDGSAKRHFGPVDLRLALASKQLFAEVMTTLFEDDMINLEINPNASIGLPILFRTNATSAAYWPLENIKRVQIRIFYNKKEESRFVDAELVKFCNIIRHCSLTRLQLITYYQKGFYSKELEESFDQALAPLEMLRNVQDLVFNEDSDWRWMESNSHRRLGTDAYRERLRSIVTKPMSPYPKEVDE